MGLSQTQVDKLNQSQQHLDVTIPNSNHSSGINLDKEDQLTINLNRKRKKCHEELLSEVIDEVKLKKKMNTKGDGTE